MITPATFTELVAWPPGATATDIADAERRLGRTFPEDYRQVLMTTDGPQGDISDETYLTLWSIREVLRWNTDPGAHELFPDIVVIGSNGGLEGYGIVYSEEGVAYVGFPFIGEDELIVVLGSTFDELIERIKRTPPPWT